MKSAMKSLLAVALSLAALVPNAAQADDLRAGDTFAVIWERLQNSGFKGKHEGLDWTALKTEHSPTSRARRTSPACARKSTNCWNRCALRIWS